MPHKSTLALRADTRENEYYRELPNIQDGAQAVITFSFMNSVPDGVSTRFGDPRSTFREFSSTQKSLIITALKTYSSFANIIFVQTDAPNANLVFGQFDMPGNVVGSGSPIGYDKVAGAMTTGSKIWLDAFQDFSLKGDGMNTILHEVGHSLGLKHPFEGPHKLSGKELSSSAMSYNYSGPNNKLGLLDMIAIQEIYGPAEARLGKNIYKFGKDKLIWDGGGVDTIDAYGVKHKIVLNLQGGTWNYINKKTSSITDPDQIYIGDKTLIENARGSKFNDRIWGNEADNLLRGMHGNDRIDGRYGNDKLYGDAGNDTLFGGNGDDTLAGNSGNDNLQGGAGNDYLSGSSGNDLVRGGAGADRLYGGSGKDTFQFTSYSELGDLDSFDRIRDFQNVDKIDFSRFDANREVPGRQKMTFLGNGTNDAKLHQAKAGQFYYNTSTDNLVIDANGDNIADHFIQVAGVSSMKTSYFII